MRISGNTPKKSPGERAAKYVAKENGTPLNLSNSTKHLIPTKFNNSKQHSLFNLKTNQKEHYTNQKLLELARNFIPWVRSQTRCRLYQDYWLEIGFGKDTVSNLGKQNQEFKKLVEAGNELIDMLWGDVLLGEFDVIKGDINTIRQRAPIYIKAWKAYDKEMIEFKEKIRHALEKQDELTKEEVIAWVTQGMDWIKSKEEERETRVNAEQRRPKIESKDNR